MTDRTSEFISAIPVRPPLWMEPAEPSAFGKAWEACGKRRTRIYNAIADYLTHLISIRSSYLHLPSPTKPKHPRLPRMAVPIVRHLYGHCFAYSLHPVVGNLTDEERDSIDRNVKDFVLGTMEEIHRYREELDDVVRQHAKTLLSPSQKSPHPLGDEGSDLDQTVGSSLVAFGDVTTWSLSLFLNEITALQKRMQEKRYEREVEKRSWRSEMVLEDPDSGLENGVKATIRGATQLGEISGMTKEVLGKVGLASVGLFRRKEPIKEVDAFAAGLGEIAERLKRESDDQLKTVKTGLPTNSTLKSRLPAAHDVKDRNVDGFSGSISTGKGEEGPGDGSAGDPNTSLKWRDEDGEVTSTASQRRASKSWPATQHPSITRVKNTRKVTFEAATLDAPISPTFNHQERQQLLLEQTQLHNQFQSELEELTAIQTAITDISSLQSNLSLQITTQSEKVQMLFQESEEQANNVLSGNESLKKAKKTLRSAYKYVSYLMLLLAFVLAFLDWWNG